MSDELDLIDHHTVGLRAYTVLSSALLGVEIYQLKLDIL